MARSLRTSRAAQTLARPFRAGNRRWMTPVAALILLIGLIAGAVIVSSVTRRHVRLDDGTVWVTSLADRKAARFNVRVAEADAAVASSSDRFDIDQQDGTTVLDETSRISGIDAASIAVTGTTETGGGMVASLGGRTVAVLDPRTGDVWTAAADGLEGMSTDGSPAMELGAGGMVAIDHDGAVYGLRSDDGAVLRLDGPDDTTPSELHAIGAAAGGRADSFSVVGGVPVAGVGGLVAWADGQADTGSDGPLTIQEPPTDDVQQGWVAAAAEGGLYLVDLDGDGGTPTYLDNGGEGAAATPVSTNGCVYGAWSQRANNVVRVCSPEDADAGFSTLQEVSATSDLRFRTNHRLVILNDVVNGNVWNPDDSTDVIKIQWNTLQTEQESQDRPTDQSADNAHDFSATCSADSGEIRAEDDGFGVRTGARQILDVLRNDEQTDCSVLSITAVGAPSEDGIDVEPVYDGRYLQLDASEAAAGTATFTYEIGDGRGQTSSATVTLTIADDDNRAPEQTDLPPEVDVEQGATYTANALASFSDADGDPMTLVSAVVRNTDQAMVSTRADGQLVFDSGSMTSGRVEVEATVSDGRETGTGTLYFSVRPANTLTPVIDPVVRRTAPDTETVIDLKPYVHGTSAQPVRLSAVETPTGATATMNASDMSITFSAQDPGTYYVPYTVTQGSVEDTGLARVEVEPVQGDAARPIAANDVALLGAGDTAIVEPLTNDVDPMGGVLAVTSVETPPDSGIKAGVVGNRRVYLTARRIPAEPVEVSYTVANAAGTSQGVIVLQPPALGHAGNAPKASDIDAGVRTGGIVSIDVLDHVSYSDGTTVTLLPDLQYDADSFDGLVFVSGDTVRYQAGDSPGSYKVTYTVRDDLGNAASGTITITVHRRDADNKPAPTPGDVQAQVAAGGKVRIPITLTGIDADGDDDILLGLGNTAPTLGRITEVGADYMIYEAYADSSGTDTFSYAVEDWTGQRAQARIRVGVFRAGADSGVYARDDAVTLRPGTAATVPVTINDICGDDAELTVRDELETQGIADASVTDNVISFTTPQQAGTAYIIYTVANKAGISDTATLTVTVDPDATIEPPTAYDYRVPASATVDKRTVEVDVSPWIANPSGTADELRVAVDPSATDHARMKGGEHSTTVSIELTDEARAVPYTVTNTTYGVTSTAFIQVPAYGVFPPTLRPKAPELRVNARETITISIADYVRVGAGKTVYVESADSVSATKAADDDLYVDDQTLRFTAPADYAGPASITFTAVDGREGDAKIINSAVITLPITVVGREVPPPTFSSSDIDVVAGEAATVIDLTSLTHTPEGLYADETAYTYSGGTDSAAITASVSRDGRLTVSAPRDATVGTVVSIPITITYTQGTVSAGITARVVQSTRPLAQLRSHAVKLKAGGTQTVNVVADAYNPFPGDPLTVGSCRSDNSAKLTVDCRDNGSIVITAAHDIGASTNTVLVTVRDATGSKDREVTGQVNVSVIDRPAAPLLSPIAGEPADGAIDLSWTPGSSNGSPVTEYQVEWDGGDKSCGASTTCQVTGLVNGETYSFTVRARNEAGWSDVSNAVEGTPDRVPTAPGNVEVEAGYRTATVTWDAPDYEGTAPDSYTVTLTGSTGWSSTKTADGERSMTFEIPNEAIADGATFSATVTAHNRAGDGEPSAPGDAVRAWGDPQAPTVKFEQSGEQQVTLRVAPGDGRNAGCRSIRVSGAVSDSLGCQATESTYHVSRSQLWKPFEVTVTMVPERAGAASASVDASVTPTYEVREPSDVSVSGRRATCTVRWRGNGEHDGFNVSLEGFQPVTLGENATSHDFTLSEWQRCGTATVTQTLLGNTGPAASGSSDYVYAVPAKLDGLWVEWDDATTVTIHGYDFDTWGQEATFTLTINGKEYAVAAGQPTVSVKDLPVPDDDRDGDADGDVPGGGDGENDGDEDDDPGDDYAWTFAVKGVNDDRLDNETSGHISNERPAVGEADPSAFSMRRFQSLNRYEPTAFRLASTRGNHQ